MKIAQVEGLSTNPELAELAMGSKPPLGRLLERWHSPVIVEKGIVPQREASLDLLSGDSRSLLPLGPDTDPPGLSLTPMVDKDPVGFLPLLDLDAHIPSPPLARLLTLQFDTKSDSECPSDALKRWKRGRHPIASLQLRDIDPAESCPSGQFGLRQTPAQAQMPNLSGRTLVRHIP